MADISVNKMEQMSITVDVSAVENALSSTLLNHKQIMRKVLSTIGKNQAKAFNAGITSATASRSGELKKSYHYKVKVNDFEEKVTLFAKGKDKSKSIYPKLMALNYGATIKPLKKKVLHFQRGQWYSAHEVQIRGRHFLEPAWDAYAGSGAYQKDVEEMIEKELKKYWG